MKEKKPLDFNKPTWLSLGHDVGTRINNYAEKIGVSDPNMVIRELVMIALSVDPATAISNAIRIKAYNDVRTWAVNELYTRLGEMYHTLKREIDGGN